MVLTFKNYNKGDATISDVQEAWKRGQLPKEVVDYFKDAITDTSIRSLHQSGFKMFKDSLVVDNVIEFGDFIAIVSKDRGDWQIVFYEYVNDRFGKRKASHQETKFVKSDKNLLIAIRNLIKEYTLK